MPAWAASHPGSSIPAIAPLSPITAPTPSFKKRAAEIFLADRKVADWLERYPPHPTIEVSIPSPSVSGVPVPRSGEATVDIFSGAAGEIATGTVDVSSGVVLAAFTGPQVAWYMARGTPGAFGGVRINSYTVWLGFCVVFLFGLVDWRRPLSLRTADLLMLLSFSVSLWFFNRGEIFAAMSVAFPCLLWLLVRFVWVGVCDRPARGSVVWPTWLLVAMTVFLVGFRVGLNIETSNVIDVGYSGVVGASLIANGQSPYGNFPVQNGLPSCHNGTSADHIQTNGRCETADPEGDTYGPFAYEAYLPAFYIFGWNGEWNTLPAAHATSIVWDLIAIFGMWMVGRRYGGSRLGATLAFSWTAWPFTQYASNSNTNDMIMPAVLIWAFYFASTPFVRGGLQALASLTKFAPLLLFPLWLGYPTVRGSRSRVLFVCGFSIAAALSGSVLLFEPSLLHSVETFVHRTFGYQLGRASPFSIWDWRQYHAKGLPNLHLVQNVLQGLLVAGALLLGVVPARRSPLRLAAFSGALLVGFQMVLTYWIYLYLPWFFPFAALALIAPRTAEQPVTVKADAPLPGVLAPA